MAGEETEEVKGQAVIEADFAAKTVKKITISEDTKPAKFLRDCANWAKKNKVSSVMVLMVDENDHCDWITEISTDYHAALIALTLEDAKEDVKAILFQEDEIEVE